ncbi:hypothetical protein HF888_12275 [Bermanella marisrubri]|uniref:DUF6985 domain-containing protein n=1 Tax=Bermanella marisrubri TaxID=207949 RepID=Q1MZX1_9GAMM|nr:hypothetical protein [Bermanella marisrubri]EAT11592.1 hypothetical protein RED65_02939 [Oceanobacter sp. RED65] [Bermanella marisrubri]QIZ84947.1 hypothetical protein HF888_12275 [Bermanella marisrubri]
MHLEKLEEWLRSLRQEDDLLVGEIRVPFLSQEDPIEVCFVGQQSAVTDNQLNTMRGYLERVEDYHAKAVERIFNEYQATIEISREAFREWKENPDVSAPRIDKPDELASLLVYQSMFIPAWREVGTFGMGFWAKWEVEHGVGLRFEDWQISEAGENAVHFQFG